MVFNSITPNESKLTGAKLSNFQIYLPRFFKFIEDDDTALNKFGLKNSENNSKFNYFKPENDLENNYWFTLNDEDLNKFTGKIFPNYIIYLNNRVNDKNYPLQKNITANISNNHLKYALTWFSLAISIFLIYLYFRKKNY